MGEVRNSVLNFRKRLFVVFFHLSFHLNVIHGIVNIDREVIQFYTQSIQWHEVKLFDFLHGLVLQ